MSWDDLFAEEEKEKKVVKKISGKDKKIPKKEEKKVTRPRKRPKLIKKSEIPQISVDEIRLKVMEHLIRHNKRHRHLLGHLPKSWGGRLTSGGGWSAGWLQLLEIIAEVLPDLIAQKI
ncbi:MAG: hypothetical protein ACTSRG_06360 [Candidatus Helarchaeota archaeon]